MEREKRGSEGDGEREIEREREREREGGMEPERSDTRGEGQMKRVLPLEELWLPVSISSQAAVNEQRGKNTIIHTHTHTHTHTSQELIVRVSLGAGFLPQTLFGYRPPRLLHNMFICIRRMLLPCLHYCSLAVSDGANIITPTKALPI